MRLFRYSILIVLVLALFSAGTVFAGGRGERRDAPDPPAATDPPPAPRRDRIEFNRDRTTDTNDTETPQQQDERDPLWLMVVHELREEMAAEVTSIIQRGYVPVGIERITGEGMSMLYIRSSDLEIGSWRITEIDNLDNLNEELTGYILDGWTPMDITTSHGNALTVLMLETNLPVSGWQITVGDPAAEEIVATYERYRDQGFVSYGISVDSSNRLWYLFLSFSGDGTPSRPLLNAFQGPDLVEGINTDVGNGLLPWGIAEENDLFFVQYLF